MHIYIINYDIHSNWMRRHLFTSYLHLVMNDLHRIKGSTRYGSQVRTVYLAAVTYESTKATIYIPYLPNHLSQKSQIANGSSCST